MALTDQQQTSILQLTQAMFNATPGAIHLEALRAQMAAGKSLADLAQSLSGSDLFFGRNYSANLTPSQFAVAFVDDLVSNRASTDDKTWAINYIISKMAAGATQAELIAELAQTLSAVPASDPHWGEAATHYNISIATKIVDNLVDNSVAEANKAFAVDYIVAQIAAGQTFGVMVEQAITALDSVDHADPVWGDAAALFDNRIEVSRYYSIDKAGTATDLAILQNILAGISADVTTVVIAKAAIDISVINLSSLDGSNGFRLDGAAANDYSGFSVSGAGDINGDGFADLLVGAEGADPNGSYSGSSYVVFGKAAGFTATLNLSSLDGSNGFRVNGTAADDLSGYSVSGAGDFNGDGFADLIISAPYADPSGSSSGSSYVVFGNNFTAAVTFLGRTENDSFVAGTSLAERFVAGNGNDTMVGGGGADVFYGGAGSDTIEVADLGFQLVDGGPGDDTLALTGNSLNLDLAGVRGRISDIETINLTGSGNNTLTVNALDLLNLSDTRNTLKVNGNAENSIVGLSHGWTDGGVNGGYHTYIQGAAVLLVGVHVTTDFA
ncbi:FG-GAP repeat protein [Nitrosomonas sp. Nm166]|uniref:FG-GAP repeat protein n=1 Tax=Nitrosomonas sp. Nm166 TaxID=1881054 RepID=UPI0008F42461|nr:FG-GAP repeat protein [Nitrosomonas sp. Nm166]SFD93678.1 FG-GAP repeat-containing protein [Nitrosomonas sp. Nm166]